MPVRPSLRACAPLLLLAVAGCTLGSSTGTSSQPRGTPVPTATAVGTPLGLATAIQIGPEGGALAADDGAWTLTVPAGAVAAATTFSATPLTSHAPGALTQTVRLEADQPLAGPVKVTFKGLGSSYPSGVALKSLAIRYQDARGFWVAPDGLSYDAAADTVTATTPHLSDWALVLGQTPDLQGTFTLTQTVGVPFTASGTGALYAWTSATEPTYWMTGTVTLDADTLTAGSATCTPDARAHDLELSVAEVHGADFRWGMNARWALTCTDPSLSQDLATLFDTLQINLTSCGGSYVGTQVNGDSFIQGQYTKTCGTGGVVSATWDFRACWDGLSCQPSDPCRTGTTTCNGGIGTCNPTGNAADGTPCGTSGACVAGACVGG
ncbi:hypothetical protein [Anaeromyxobacter paludicola]|uniref:Lipoprotein n=1 Tax=Anaeromyxobacter paludicola TaxID=2918171 RepID=A0ABM7XBI9_9BACT|nr:hypothetical protein [Anaeromyxobacter paludicola]BDG09215.1 hypothetical protein AMPC_23280 [Anaeromyxobacter paludicola]